MKSASVKILTYLFFAFILCVLAAVKCQGSCLKTNEIKTLLQKNIKIGDDRKKVDAVLKNADIDYTYDEFQNRYGSTIRDAECGSWQAISVYVNFNKSGKVSGVEVFDSYTAL
jgi:hypothetical protein